MGVGGPDADGNKMPSSTPGEVFVGNWERDSAD